MNIMLLLIPISFLLIVAAVYSFFWAVDHDQFSALDAAARAPLEDEKPVLEHTEISRCLAIEGDDEDTVAARVHTKHA